MGRKSSISINRFKFLEGVNQARKVIWSGKLHTFPSKGNVDPGLLWLNGAMAFGESDRWQAKIFRDGLPTLQRKWLKNAFRAMMTACMGASSPFF